MMKKEEEKENIKQKNRRKKLRSKDKEEYITFLLDNPMQALKVTNLLQKRRF